MRAFIVAHARPFVGPSALAARAFVEVEKPGHANLLGSQTIITPRDELDKSAVAQILKLLPYLGFDVLVAGIEIAEMPFESVDLIKCEVAFPELLHAFHDIEQPAAGLRRFAPEKQRLLPFRKDKLFS